MLITLRLRSGLPSLRVEAVCDMLRRIFAEPRIRSFQAVHYSIQTNHLHMIVEAGDKPTLTSGLRSLIIRVALRLNRLLGRKGGVFGDRYHRRDLQSPSEVRNALRYVLTNLKKHGLLHRTSVILDGYSSALTVMWSGFEDILAALPAELLERIRPRAPATWLLAIGWTRAGRLCVGDAPA